jgi:hypothetical protein
MKQTTQHRLTVIEKKLESLMIETSNSRIKNSREIMNLFDSVSEIRKETISLSRLIGSLLDIISDTTNIPKQIITERFMFYNQERHPVDSEGKVKGELKVTGYNLELTEG